MTVTWSVGFDGLPREATEVEARLLAPARAGEARPEVAAADRHAARPRDLQRQDTAGIGQGPVGEHRAPGARLIGDQRGIDGPGIVIQRGREGEPRLAQRIDSARREVDVEMHGRRVRAAGEFGRTRWRQIRGRGLVHLQQLDGVAVAAAAWREVVDAGLRASRGRQGGRCGRRYRRDRVLGTINKDRIAGLRSQEVLARGERYRRARGVDRPVPRRVDGEARAAHRRHQRDRGVEEGPVGPVDLCGQLRGDERASALRLEEGAGAVAVGRRAANAARRCSVRAVRITLLALTEAVAFGSLAALIAAASAMAMSPEPSVESWTCEYVLDPMVMVWL